MLWSPDTRCRHPMDLGNKVATLDTCNSSPSTPPSKVAVPWGRPSALVGLPRAEPRRAIAAVGAWLCEGWCHLSAAVPGHRGGCVRHPGATLEGGGRNSRPAGAVSWLLSSCKGFPVSSGPSCMDRTDRLFCMHRDRTVNRGMGSGCRLCCAVLCCGCILYYSNYYLHAGAGLMCPLYVYGRGHR